jgi:Zn-dependent peptidase ImmA (M78 family)
MALRRSLERARWRARELLLELGMNEPAKIDPFVVLARRQIPIIYGKLDGATAQLSRHRDRAIIRISDQIVQLGRVRFSIAHEIGHYLLGHGILGEGIAEATELHTRHQEREADVFASEFLMPEELVRPFCDRTPIDLTSVGAVAETFRTSIVSAAVRYVELSPAPCAVVYSEAGFVEWAKRSRSFPARIPAQLEVGPRALAFDYFASGTIDVAPRVMPASAWLGRWLPLAITSLVEHAAVVPEPGWGGVLSLLSPGHPSSDEAELASV